MARTPQDVTETELALLQALWEGGPSTIPQLTDRLYPGGGASQYASVQKLPARLEVNGYVRRDRPALAHTPLAAPAPLASLLCRRPPLAHALWLLALLQLVTPPLFPVPVLAPPAPAPPVGERARHPGPAGPKGAPAGPDEEEPFGEWVAGVTDWDGPPAPTPEPPEAPARGEALTPAPAPGAEPAPAGAEV